MLVLRNKQFLLLYDLQLTEQASFFLVFFSQFFSIFGEKITFMLSRVICQCKLSFRFSLKNKKVLTKGGDGMVGGPLGNSGGGLDPRHHDDKQSTLSKYWTMDRYGITKCQSSLVGDWKCYLENYNSSQTSRPTNQQTDMRGHREVTQLPLKVRWTYRCVAYQSR